MVSDWRVISNYTFWRTWEKTAGVYFKVLCQTSCGRTEESSSTLHYSLPPGRGSNPGPAELVAALWRAIVVMQGGRGCSYDPDKNPPLYRDPYEDYIKCNVIAFAVDRAHPPWEVSWCMIIKFFTHNRNAHNNFWGMTSAWWLALRRSFYIGKLLVA
jgi:hypothetical protein